MALIRHPSHMRNPWSLNKSQVGLSLLAIVLVMKLFTGTFGKTKVLAALSTNI